MKTILMENLSTYQIHIKSQRGPDYITNDFFTRTAVKGHSLTLYTICLTKDRHLNQHLLNIETALNPVLFLVDYHFIAD